MRLAFLALLPLLLGAQTRIDLATQSKGELPIGTRDKIRYAHLFAESGSGTDIDPYIFATGNPWAEAVADGGSVIYLTPGTYSVTTCPATIPSGVSIIGLNRESTTLKADCHAIKNRVEIIAATNAVPIEITTALPHGLTTNDTVNIAGVPGNLAANGDFSVTMIDATRFTLNGSSGSGAYVDTDTGMWASEMFPITDFETQFPVRANTSLTHNIVTGDRVFIRGVPGSFEAHVNGFHFVTAVDADSVDLEGTATPGNTDGGGFVAAVVPTSVVSTTTDARGVEIRGLSFLLSTSGSWLSKIISFRANESVIEDVQARFDPAALAQSASTFLQNKDASISFTADAGGADTLALTLTGGGSRAAGAYTTYSPTFEAAVGVTAVTSAAGSNITVTLAANRAYEDGDEITISTTPETTAAGVAGTFRVVRRLANLYDLAGEAGTGTNCSSGCGGATAVQVSLEKSNLAREFAEHLNGNSEFKRDYFADPEGPLLRLLERRVGASPDTFSLSTAVANTTSPWTTGTRGGVFFLMMEGNSFSNRVARAFCSGGGPMINCMGLVGVNNQHSYRDVRLSGGLNAGWGFRFAGGSNIQNVDVYNITTEASYGAVEIGSLVSGSIRTVYMENDNEFGVRVIDPVGAAQSGGFGFTHGVSIQGGLLLGTPGLDLQKGKGITAENIVAPGGCVIGERCEDCRVVASWVPTCDVRSPGGYVESVTLLDKTNPGTSRYGERMATAAAALLSEPVTNFAKQSDNLTAAPWFANSKTSLVSDTNPFGGSQSISRTTTPSPAQFETVAAATYAFTGLAADTLHTVSYWVRVQTAGGTCALNGEGSSINRQVQVKPEDGWVRVAGPVTTNGSGAITIAVRCSVIESGLADFTYDIWGFMLHRPVTGGALMPYIPTTTSAVTVGRGLYVAPGAGAAIAPGGSTPSCQNYRVQETALTAASTTQDVVLFNLPARGKLTALSVKHSQPFSGGGLTGMTVSVGDSSSTTFYSTAFDIFQSVSNTAMQDTNLFKSSTAAARDVRARFISTGANVVDATSGAVDVSACWVVMP